MEEISIRDILKILKKNWVWLVVVPLVTGLLAMIYYIRQPNDYTAETRLYVLMEYTDSTGQVRYDTTTSTLFTGDFKELIKTKQVYQETADRLGISLETMDHVNIDISGVTGTRVLIVSATSTSPSLSLNIANTISQVFIEYVTRLMKTDAVSIAAEATLPDQPSGPSRIRNTMLAILISLILVSIVIITLRMINTKITTIEEVEEQLKISVLASISDYREAVNRYMRAAEHHEMLSNAVSLATMEGVRTLATNIQFACNGEMLGTTIMLTSSITTEGKSTLTMLLAEALSDDGFNVLMCDFDVKRPSLGRYVGKRNRYDIIDYLTEKAPFTKIIEKTNQPYVYFSDFNHQNYSISQIIKHPGFQCFLSEAKKHFNIILFDTPPLGMFIDAAMLAPVVDETLLVIGSGMVERTQVQEVTGQLKKANANLLGVALNYTHTEKGNRYYYNQYGYRDGGRNHKTTSQKETDKSKSTNDDKAVAPPQTFAKNTEHNKKLTGYW